MIQVYRAYHNLVLPALLVGLMVALVVCVMYRRRVRGDWTSTTAARTGVVELIVLGDLLCYLLLTWTPGHAPQRALNLIPFREYSEYLSDPEMTAPLTEILGNVVLLAPLAAVAWYKWRRLESLWRTVGLVAVIALVTETYQFVTDSGRVASITDVLSQAMGAALAWSCCSALRRLRSHRRTRTGEAVAAVQP